MVVLNIGVYLLVHMWFMCMYVRGLWLMEHMRLSPVLCIPWELHTCGSLHM